jgi:hypothetical protein
MSVGSASFVTLIKQTILHKYGAINLKLISMCLIVVITLLLNALLKRILMNKLKVG